MALAALIASSNKGYKLPANIGDIYDYFNLSNLIVKPLIQRMKLCRDKVNLATKGEVDLFKNDEFRYLDKLTT